MRAGRAALLVVVLTAGCAMQRHREQVREGFLTRGLHRDAFLAEWGRPTRTYSVPTDDVVFRTEGFGAAWERPIWEVWEYRDRATCLAFDGVRLVMWETEKTSCEPKPPRERRPLPAPPYPPAR